MTVLTSEADRSLGKPSGEAARTSKEISQKLKVISFLMTCLVVCYHCGGFDDAYALGAWDRFLNEQVEEFMEHAGSLAMSYFFTVTGYLLFCGFRLAVYPQKLRRRFLSLFVPYLFWQCLYFITKSIFQPGSLSLSFFLKYTFCLERWPLNGALWYVYAVFLLAIASPLLEVFFRNKRSGLISTVLLILFIRFLRISTNPYVISVTDHGYLSNVLHYLPCYLAGCYLGRFSQENTKSDAFLFLFILLLTSYLFDDIFPNFFVQTVIGLLPLLGLYALPPMPALQGRKIYRLSFLMYAIHQPLLFNIDGYLHGNLMLMLPMPGFARSILVRGIALMLDIGLACLIHTVLKRCCPKLLAVITGGRTA